MQVAGIRVGTDRLDDNPLETPIQFVRGVGPVRGELFARLGLQTASDLLFYVPRDVLDLTQVSAVHELTDDRVHTVRGEVVDRDARQLSNGRSLVAILLKCDGGYVRGSWFNQSYMLRKFDLGQRVLFSGQPKFRERRWEFGHPRVQWLGDDDADATPGVLPRYGLTEGLRMEEVRRATAAAVTDFAEYVPELLPTEFLQRQELSPIRVALEQLHQPQTVAEYQAGRHRVIFDDLLEFELALALRRRYWQRENKAVPVPCTAKIDARIRRLFPFPFTAGQNQAVQEIMADMARDRAMHRLLQADVGAGKTAVAVYAMLAAIAAGQQAVLMAPTEILAQQHWQTIDGLLQHSRVERRLLTGQIPQRVRQTMLQEIGNGAAQLVIGTQAVIQADVHFAKLGLAVIDEQHKFGVGQRSRFAGEGMTPHILVMTATPIPRSLCLTQFGDLDVSAIHELPPGRQKIVTNRVFGTAGMTKVWDFILRKVGDGRQAYVVCPRIESEDGIEEAGGTSAAARTVFADLSAGALHGIRVGLIHGQLPREEREATMDAFRVGDLDVLVSTTVIEVGVDVPNATLMVIYQAERFGLSQLHQLRGRIGRGKFQGYCFLCSTSDQPDAVKRLTAMETTSDGFKLAEVDFALRGPGDVLGTRQHGALPLRVADIVRDQEILLQSHKAAFALVDSGEFDSPEYAPLKIRVLDRFRKIMDLPQTG